MSREKLETYDFSKKIHKKNISYASLINEENNYLVKKKKSSFSENSGAFYDACEEFEDNTSLVNVETIPETKFTITSESNTSAYVCSSNDSCTSNKDRFRERLGDQTLIQNSEKKFLKPFGSILSSTRSAQFFKMYSSTADENECYSLKNDDFFKSSIHEQNFSNISDYFGFKKTQNTSFTPNLESSSNSTIQTQKKELLFSNHALALQLDGQKDSIKTPTVFLKSELSAITSLNLNDSRDTKSISCKLVDTLETKKEKTTNCDLPLTRLINLSPEKNESNENDQKKNFKEESMCKESAHSIVKADMILSTKDQDNLTRITEGSAGPTSLLPVRNITTGTVQFLNTATNGLKNQNIQDYLNVFLMADIEVTRLQEPISGDSSISGDKVEEQDEETFMFEATNLPTNKIKKLFEANSKKTHRFQQFTLSLPNLKNRIVSRNLSRIVTENNCFTETLNKNSDEPGRFKSMFLKATETLQNSKSFYSSFGPNGKNKTLELNSSLRHSTMQNHLLLQYWKRRSPPFPVRIRKGLGKPSKILTNIWLLQQLELPPSSPIWSLAISSDGKWLSVGSQDGTLQLWKLEKLLEYRPLVHRKKNSSNEDKFSKLTSFEIIDLDSNVSRGKNQTTKSLYSKSPAVTLLGHSATIVTCVWDFLPLQNNANRLASVSLDRTVRIWTVSENEEGTLRYSVLFNCGDWATCAAFHPISRNIIYTGGLDGVAQIWKAPLHVKGYSDVLFHHSSSTFEADKVEMLDTLRLPDLITSMTVSPNGKYLVIGLRLGSVFIYDTNTMSIFSKIECRNRKGPYASGRKVTGFCWNRSSNALIISTSDCRIRLVNLNDTSTWIKFKGHKCNEIMLSAIFSPDENYVVCGSETGFVHLWDITTMLSNNKTVLSRKSSKINFSKTNRQSEKFKAFDGLLTCCIVGNENFANNTIAAINEIAKTSDELSPWKYIQKTLQERPFNNGASTSTALTGLVIVTADFRGRLKFFINTTFNGLFDTQV
ncbi:WD repeat-containing protein 44-like isoform X2 [Hylaeus volcanicus]|uniref:WD repeat-containing protein 44-like isoform X2 n=1 Tax=Hylaeus volcanicus TaxID=313075 RepID=UPI0023B7A7C5|nr:WD repeat-containing protein 44-like isoform X2 [Hylaeus volcanicus]